MEEKYFPRGSSEKKTDSAKRTRPVPRKRKLHDEAEEEESNKYLFGPQASSKKSKNAKEKERKRRKRQEAKEMKEKEDDEVEDNEHHLLEEAKQLEEEDKFVEETFESKPFHLKILKEDMIVLGAVKEIREFELIVSLPNGIVGHVQITRISNVFTNLLEKLSSVAMEEEDLESATSLTRLYKVGDLVSCRVLNLKAEKDSYTRVDLSLNPADVNKDLMISMIHTNMILNGVVQSVEDHGFTIETGIEGVNVFLEKDDADDYLKMNPGSKLRIAEPVRCLVTKVTSHNRFVSVTLDLDKISETDSSSSPIAELQPGRLITAVIQKVKETYLNVSFGSGGYRGCIDVIHLREINHTTKMYKRNQEHKSVIIYQCPTTKTFGLSLNAAHFGMNISERIKKASLDGLKSGTKFKKSKILRVDEKRGALCDLHIGYKGYAVPSDYPEKQQPPSVNDVLPCRVLYFQLFDLVAKVSFKESILNQRFLGYSEISPGQVLEGQVLNILDNGVSVALEKNVTGFIPREHVADIPIKNIAGLFQEGGTIKLRVLMVNPDERKLLLTHKKTLVESQLPIISSYDQFEEGQIVHGTIIFVKDYGCVVKFYNNVSGLIHRSELSNNSSIDPTANFYKGQVVKCQVIKTFNPELQKCHLSLRHVKADVSQQGDNEGDSSNAKITSGTVTSLSKDGLTIVTGSKQKEAFIPMMHLCNHPSQEKVALKSFKVGDSISPVLLWGKEGKKHIASCKPMIYRVARKEYRSLSSPYDLEENAITLGVVEEVNPEGVFVSFPDNFVGFCPRNSSWGLEGALPFSHGETVKVKVLKIHWRKKTVDISLNVSDVFQKGDEGLIHDLLSDHFELQDRMSSLLGEKGVALSELKVGSNVTGQVTKVKDRQIIAKTEGGVAAVICENEGSDLTVGSSVRGCVLDVDYLHRNVIITLKENIALAAKKKVGKRKGLKKLQSKPNSGYADVVFTSDLYHLVLVDDQLSYTPTKNHLNDSSSSSSVIYSVPIGQKRVMSKIKGRLVVQSLSQGEEKKKSAFQAMGSFQSSWSDQGMENQSDKDLSEQTKAKVDLVSRSMGVTLGQTVTVIVKAVFKEYALVRTESDVLGRIHITELTDSLPRGKSLLDACHGGQKFTARIIGFLFHKDGKFFQIRHPRFTRLALELTTRPSKLEKSNKIEEKTLEEELESYKTGQKVLTFPMSYDKDYVFVLVSPRIQGVIHIQDLSDKITVQANPERFFPYACALELEVWSIDWDTKQLVLTCNSKKGKGNTKLRSGQVVTGKVTDIVEGSIYIQLPGGVLGSAFVTDVRDHFRPKALKGFSPGQLIKCYILNLEDRNHAAVSLRPSRVTGKKEKDMDKDIQSLKDLKEGEEVKGYIMDVTEDEITVSLARNISAKITIPFDSSRKDYVPGLPIKVVVKSIKKGKLTLSFSGDEEVGRKFSEEKEGGVESMEEGDEEEDSDEDEAGDEDDDGEEERSGKHMLSISHDEKVRRNFSEDDEDVEESMEGDDEGEDSDEEDDDKEEVGDEDEERNEKSRSRGERKKSEEAPSGEKKDEKRTKLMNKKKEKPLEKGKSKVAVEAESSEGEESEEESGEESEEMQELMEQRKNIKKKELEVGKGKSKVMITTESSDSEESEVESKEKQEQMKQRNKREKEMRAASKMVNKELKNGQALAKKDGEEKRKGDIPTPIIKETRKEKGLAKEERGKKRKDALSTEKSKMKSLEKARLQISDVDAWEEGTVPHAVQKDDSDSESDEEEEVTKEPPKKKTKQQRQEEARAEEEFLYKREHALMDSDRPPETVDDFDRLVTTSPNSSIVWIRFMAFHLDAGDVERARAVAERALKTINFREEQEKLNIWVAFMNLENSNGTEETLLKVFERALSNCEPYRVFEHLIDIYTRSGKIESAEALYNTMLKRFRQEKSVWVQFGTFLMHHGKPEAARNLLQKSFKSLLKKDHIDCISKFAQLEYKSGEPEQGQTMFENILSNYPKRTDIWSIYLDMVIKSGDLTASRHLFDRVITLNLSPKKIKFFFKRYLEFEKKHGTEEQVNAVKQKAVEYVESKSGLELSET